MFSHLTKAYKVLDKKEKKIFFLVILLSFFSAIFEMLGVALILPVLAVLLKDQISENIEILGMNLSNVTFDFENYSLVFLLSVLVGIFVFKNIILFFVNYFNNWYVQRIGNRISQNIYKQYMNENYSFHLENNSSKLMYNCIGAVENFVIALSNILLIFGEILIILFLATLLILVEPKGFLLGFIFIVIASFVILRTLKNFIIRWGQEAQTADRERIFHISHGLDGIREIKIFKKANYFLDKFFKSTKRRFEIAHYYNSLTALPRYSLECFFVAALVLFLFYLKINDKPNHEIILILGIFGMGSIRLMPSFNKLLMALQKFKFGYKHIDTMHNIIFKDSFFKNNNNVSMNGIENLENKNQETLVNFENVGFKYPEKKKDIFKQIDLKIYKNEFLGIVGKTGVGKSTLLNLILGLHFPTKGNITRNFNEISFVPQSIFVLDDTILKNIAFGIEDSSINVNLAAECIKKAQLENFVEKLPNGINTIVGERGTKISGGELQRLAIARALYVKPDIIIFDEATASLDVYTEKKIIEIIKNLSKLNTVVFVSHKLENLRHCNRVIKVENSQIVDFKMDNEKLN